MSREIEAYVDARIAARESDVDSYPAADERVQRAKAALNTLSARSAIIQALAIKATLAWTLPFEMGDESGNEAGFIIAMGNLTDELQLMGLLSDADTQAAS